MRRLLLVLLISAIFARPATAQSGWALTFERGATAFSAAAHDTSTPQIRLTPWHPGLYSLRLARNGERMGAALALGYGVSDFGGSVGDIVVLPGSRLAIMEVAPECSYRISTTPLGAALRVHAGPVLDLWYPSGGDMRSSLGGLAGASLALPLATRWEVSLRADLALTTSEVTKDEAGPGLIREGSMRRGRLAVGLTRRL